jgi:hypothetical protein
MMSFWRFFLFFPAFALFNCASSVSAQPAGPGVLGFRAWKASRTDEARSALQRLQVDASMESLSALDRAPAPAAGEATVGVATKAPPRTTSAQRFERRLEQARLNVEIAQDLTVNDYFVLYLKPFKSKEAFLAAARKLSPDEMGELMLAYQKQLAGDAGEALSQAAAPAAANMGRIDKMADGPR